MSSRSTRPTKEEVLKYIRSFIEILDSEDKKKLIVGLKKEYKFNAYELKSSGFSATDLKKADIPIHHGLFMSSDLKAAGYSAKELLDAKYSVSEIVNGGYQADELKEAGITAKMVSDRGFPMSKLKDMGFNRLERLSIAAFNEKKSTSKGGKYIRQKIPPFCRRQHTLCKAFSNRLKNRRTAKHTARRPVHI
jgi:hypothetical protein